MIAPIETRYKGYRFRSRLEARWAVFFDALNLEWVYEPEGFNINGILYLPDFWLPQLQSYAEVKPAGLSEEEIHKVEVLVLESNHPCLILNGVPDFVTYITAEPHSTDDLEEAINDPDNNFIAISSDRKRFLTYSDGIVASKIVASRNHSIGIRQVYERAVYQARSARFEHGENGAA